MVRICLLTFLTAVCCLMVLTSALYIAPNTNGSTSDQSKNDKSSSKESSELIVSSNNVDSQSDGNTVKI